MRRPKLIAIAVGAGLVSLVWLGLAGMSPSIPEIPPPEMSSLLDDLANPDRLGAHPDRMPVSPAGLEALLRQDALVRTVRTPVSDDVLDALLAERNDEAVVLAFAYDPGDVPGQNRLRELYEWTFPAGWTRRLPGPSIAN